MLDGSTITGTVTAVRTHPRRAPMYQVAGVDGWVRENSTTTEGHPLLTSATCRPRGTGDGSSGDASS